MLNDFYKIGQVIMVRGQRIQIRVFENRNSHILTYQGHIIKNVSVGGFVKIPKGYNNIIGKIEGEYIQENKTGYSENRFTKESETIDRIIEVSIMGVLKDNIFIRGLVDIPLVFSDVYILMNDEVQKIFDFSGDRNNAISIGRINDYKEEELYVNASSLFASHIGIFGNTGSGKSNTLAKLYTECFKKFAIYPNFVKSKFVVIDFNGEYTDSFIVNKKVYKLSTRTANGHKIPIAQSFLEDLEIWSIICEATEKTQKPFLGRVISTYRNIRKADNKFSYLRAMISKELESYLGEPGLFPEHLTYLKQLFELLFYNCTKAFEILDTIQIHSLTNKLYRVVPGGETRWANNLDDYKEHFVDPVLNALFIESDKKTLSELNLFEVSVKFEFINELSKHYIVEEHISPLISRFENRAKGIDNIFDIIDNPQLYWLTIISLVDVNIEFKKIIPLIICKYYYQLHKQSILSNNSSLHFIIDEAHNILSTMSERESQTWKDYRLETFEEIVKEGRKFGVFLTLSSQRPSDISATIISQLHNYFIHRLVNEEDIRAIGKAVAFIDKTSYEMISVLPQGACIFTGIASNFPVLIQMSLLPPNLQPKSSTINLIDLWKSGNE